MAVQSLRARLRETVAQTILDAAEHVASEAGPAGASIQAIAQRASVSVGTIYNYFADRDELFAELLARRRAELLASLDATARQAAGGTFREQLDAFVRGVFVHFDARRTFLRLALDGGIHLPAARSGEKRRAVIEQLAARAERVV